MKYEEDIGLTLDCSNVYEENVVLENEVLSLRKEVEDLKFALYKSNLENAVLKEKIVRKDIALKLALKLWNP